MGSSDILVGYDVETDCIGELRMNVLEHVHGAIVGQSGSGKTCAMLWLLYGILSLGIPVETYVCDPKNSKDFDGILPSDHFAAGMLETAALIHTYYKLFLETQEGHETLRLILIDEYLGLINTLPDIIGGKDGKAEVEKIKSEMASMLCLSRSRRIGIWLIMQRPNSSLFAPSSGSLDNLMFALNMGKLHTQTHISLFANEHLDNEEFASTYHPSRGSGYFLQDGQPLKAIRIPLITDKFAMKKLLEKKAREKFGNF